MLLYLALDYSTPSLPGVFCFESTALYVDGVFDDRDVVPPATPAATPGTTALPGDRVIDVYASPVIADVSLVGVRPRPLRVTDRGALLSSDRRSEDH